MTSNEKLVVEAVIKCIYNKEELLSGRGGYYSGDDTREVLEELAEEIITVVKLLEDNFITQYSPTAD